jgi:DNA polymerase III delta subunit
MLYVICGADEFGVALEGERLAHEHAGDGQWVSRLESTATIQAVREAMLSAPLFADRYVVMARGLLASWTGRGDTGSAKASGGKPGPGDLAAIAQALPEQCLAILLEGDLPASNRFLKELSSLPSQVAQIRTCAMPEGQALVSWIRRTVEARGGAIEPAAADLLAQRSTGALRQISAEIDKLLAYSAPELEIKRAAVDLLVAARDDAKAFDLVDAITTKKPIPVVELTHNLLGAGEAPEMILALLSSRIRDVLLLFAAQREGLAAERAGGRVGWSPGRTANVQRSQRQFTHTDVLAAQSLLAATDIALKTRPTHERPTILLLTLMAIAQRRDMAQVESALAF